MVGDVGFVCVVFVLGFGVVGEVFGCCEDGGGVVEFVVLVFVYYG